MADDQPLASRPASHWQMSVTRFPREKNALVEGLRGCRDRNPAHSDCSPINLSHSVHA